MEAVRRCAAMVTNVDKFDAATKSAETKTADGYSNANDPEWHRQPSTEARPAPTTPSSTVRTQRTWRPPLTVGVYCITAVCGMLDAASFLGLGLIFVETMTGNILLLAFSLGVRGTHGRFAVAFPGGTVVPYLAALAAFAAGAVAGGRLVRAGETGRRAGFAIDASMIGLAVLVVALTHPGPANDARYPVIVILACAMGLQNALMRRWGILDLATNLMTLTFTGLHADSTLGGGNNPRALRRSVSILIFTASATVGAFMTRYGMLWPMLTGFVLFVCALPILLVRGNGAHVPADTAGVGATCSSAQTAVTTAAATTPGASSSQQPMGDMPRASW